MMCSRTTASGTEQRETEVLFSILKSVFHIFRLFVGDGFICHLCWSQRCNKSLKCSNPSTHNNTRLWLLKTPIYYMSYKKKLYRRVFSMVVCRYHSRENTLLNYYFIYLLWNIQSSISLDSLPIFSSLVTKHLESDERGELKEAALWGNWPCLHWSRRSTADGRCCSGPTFSWSAAHGSTKYKRERETVDSVCGRDHRRVFQSIYWTVYIHIRTTVVKHQPATLPEYTEGKASHPDQSQSERIWKQRNKARFHCDR